MSASISELFLQYIGNNFLLGGIFLLSVIYYILKAFRAKKKQGLGALLAVLFPLITVFNPFLYRYLAPAADGGTSYYRFIWIFPLTILSACFLTEIVYLLPGALKKYSVNNRLSRALTVALTLLLLAAVLFSGTSSLSVRNLSIPENKFTISRAALDISQFIHDDPDHKDGDVILAPTEIMMELESYDITIVPALPRTEYINYKKVESVYEPLLTLILEGPESPWHHMENVSYNVKSLNVKYIVTLTLFDLDGYMDYLGYPIYNRTGDYTLYKRAE